MARYTILIVDDVPENIAAIHAALREVYNVKVANSGQTALDILAAPGPVPDLILLDITMPGMNGYEVCKRIKADDRTKRTPVIFLTSKEDLSDEQRGFQVGAVDYLIKPISPRILMARVKTHLDLSRP